MVKYIHFGDRCQPYIIINLILNINIKTPFQLGIFPFNTIVKILEDNNFYDIINPELLYTGKWNYGNIIVEYDKLEYLENDKLNGYCHENQPIFNKKYKNMALMHDYSLEKNTIINYNFIKESNKLKQKNFIEYINSNELLCFISFLFESKMKDLEFEKMDLILREKYNIKEFIIIIFTNDNTYIPENLPKSYEIIFLNMEYRDNHIRSIEYKIELYKEIWIKFTNVMKKYNVEHPEFENIIDYNKIK